MRDNYKIYFSSRVINDIGDTLQEIAFITIIAYYTQSTLIAGITVSLNALVRIICSLFAIKIMSNNIKKFLRNLDLLYGALTLVFFAIFKIYSLSMNYWFLIGYETLCSLIYTYYRIYQDVIVKDVCRTNEQIARLFTTDNVISVAVSLASSLLILSFKVDVFLLLNALSFFISAAIVNSMNIMADTVRKKEAAKGLFSRIKEIKSGYPFVFSIIIVSCMVSFFYSTYNVVFQAALKDFSVKSQYIGALTGIYNIFVIFLSYIVGFLKVEHMKKIVLLFLTSLIAGLLISSSASGIAFIIIISLVYSIIGGGYNTFCQIIFQNNVKRDDIPTMKGIYNIFCGISIMLSGYVAPKLLNRLTLNLFCITMSIIVAISAIYISFTRDEERSNL